MIKWNLSEVDMMENENDANEEHSQATNIMLLN